MVLSANGIKFLKAREGFRTKAYNNGDRWTIGYGNTYYANGQPVKSGDTITEGKAEILFKSILAEFESDVTNLVKPTKLNQSQFDACVSYSYNRGSYKFASSKLIDMIIANPNDKAIAKQFEIEWGTATKYKSSLIARRKLEAELYFSDAPTKENATKTSSLSWLLVAVGLGFLISK